MKLFLTFVEVASFPSESTSRENGTSRFENDFLLVLITMLASPSKLFTIWLESLVEIFIWSLLVKIVRFLLGMKMAASCKEVTAANQRSGRWHIRTSVPAKTFTVESPRNSTFPLVICMHNINSCVRCIAHIVWLYICFACERCDMSSIIKN